MLQYSIDDLLPLVVLIPAVICIVALFRTSVQKTVIGVYLPIFTIIPTYYFWKVALLPPIDISEAVLLPLFVTILIKELRNWRITRSDLWLAIFLLAACVPDLKGGDKTASIFVLFHGLCLALTPYMIGKLIIEPHHGRIPFIKRLLILLFFSSIIALYEFRMGRNPFTILFTPLFPTEQFAWKTQIRWGHGRVSGPFGQSELAGMMLFTGVVLALYLAYYRVWEPRFKIASWIPHKKSVIVGCTLFVTFLLTQARGPWIGSLIAIPLALVGRAKNVARAATIFVLALLICGPIGYMALQKYANDGGGSAEQQTASYRALMIQNYVPIARAGGPTGWGKDFPRVWGQDSIDNEYLFVALTEGYIGFFAFCLIGVETLIDLIAAAATNPSREDRYFAFSLLGCFAGILITSYTVFLGNQPYQLFFLIAGWAQAIRYRPAPAPKVVFQQVYT